MATKTSAEVAAKWSRRAAAAEQDWMEGIDRYDGNIAEAMLAAQTRMLDNFIESVSSGRWADQVRKLNTATWKQRTKEKGSGRYASGVRASEQQVRNVMEKLLPALYSLRDSLPPKGDLEANIARAVAMQRGMHALKGQFKLG